MKKLRYNLLILIALILCSMLFLTACSGSTVTTNVTDKPKYQPIECEIDISEYNNEGNEISFNKKYEISGCSIYFDTQLSDNKIIDAWIDRVLALSNILTEHEVEQVNNIYLSDKLIAICWNGSNGEKNISFPLLISDEEVLAWILQAQFDSSFNLPYGLFAGVSAFWLKKNDYSQFVFSSIEGSDYLTELQFPIYESNNLSEKERSYAWSFSYYLVDEWLRSGKSEKELMSLTSQELGLYLTEQYNIVLPDYCFYPYSSDYEYLIKQGCFTYYINKQFKDYLIPEDRFNTSYNFLSDWLKDNATISNDSNKYFSLSEMYPIDVYLDDGSNASYAGIAYSNYLGNIIEIYSVGTFSHEYIHHILFKNGKGGYLREVFPELQANNSKYARIMWYYLFSGKASYYQYVDSDSINEKQSYADALLLYNKKSAFEATSENFNFWLFADCFSSLNTKLGQQFVNRLQSDSMYYYIARVYGGEYVWKLNLDTDITIDGKTYLEICYEWIDYVNTIK